LRQQLWAGYWLVFTSAVWGSAFVFMKVAMQDISPLYFIFLRFALAALIMAVACHRRLRFFNKKLLVASFWTGLPLALGFTLQTIGLEKTAVSNTAFISGLYVIFVPLLAIFIGRKPKTSQILIACLTVVGLMVFSVNSNFSMAIGDLLVLISAVAYAWQFLAVGHYSGLHRALLLTFGQILVTTIFCGLAAVFTEPFPTVITNSVWISLLYCGIFSTALAFLLQVRAQRVISAEKTALIATSEAIFGAYFGYLLLGESFSNQQIVGAIIIIACLISATLLPLIKKKRRVRRPLPQLRKN
jgi:drug/metabolite transporter (DMT)-like permease